MTLLAALVRAGVDAAAVSFCLALVGNVVLGLPLGTPFLALAWLAGVAVAATAARSPRRG